MRRSRPRNSYPHGEGGFTLIELLIVLVVLPLIIGAVAAAVIVIMNNTIPTDRTGTAARLADSHDAQITSAYVVRDVQSATSVSTNSVGKCNSGGGSQVLGLEWTDQSGSTIDVAYSVQPSPLQLVRYFCSGGALNSTSTVSHDVFTGLSAASVNVVATGVGGCAATSSSCAVSGGTPYVSVVVTCTDGTVTCDAGGLTSVLKSTVAPVHAGVSNIKMSVLDNTSSHYTYNLTAAPRLSSSGASGSPSSAPQNPPFIINGPTKTGNCNILVKGGMAVNDSSAGSVSIGNGDISSTGITTTNPTPSGSVTTGPKGTYPKPVTSAGVVISPYSYLVEPPSPPSTAPTYPVVIENGSGGKPWDPSTDASAHIGGILSKPLIPAIYKITNGLNLSKGVDGSQGVLFYVTGGTVNLAGNGVVDLAPLDANPQSHGWEQTTNSSPAPLPEVVVWISKNDTTPNPPTLTMGGTSNVTTITGAVYAPTTAVTMNGGGVGGGVNVQNMVLGSIASCNGGGSVPWDFTIGNHAATGTFDSPSSPSIALGTTDSDLASVIGSITPNVQPTGSVTFSVCGPENPALGCAAGNPNLVGGWNPTVIVTPTANSSTSTATSSTFKPTTVGWYCFAATYNGDANYTGSSDTSSDGCFQAGPPQVAVTSPTSGTCYGTLPSATCALPTPWPATAISGTTADPSGPGVSGVTLTIKDPAGSYWDPATSKFTSATPVQINATDTAAAMDWSTWTYSFPFTKFPPGDVGTYTIQATATDKGTPPLSGTSSTLTFKWGG